MYQGLKIFTATHKEGFFTDQLMTTDDNGELSFREIQLIKSFLQSTFFIIHSPSCREFFGGLAIILVHRC